jgi:hypothetical protein
MKKQNHLWRHLIVAGTILSALGGWQMSASNHHCALWIEIVALSTTLAGLTIHFYNRRHQTKQRSGTGTRVLARELLALGLATQISSHAQTTTLTYQGRLNVNGPQAAGNYDLRFSVWDTNTTGNQVSILLTNTATMLDFILAQAFSPAPPAGWRLPHAQTATAHSLRSRCANDSAA